MRRILRWPDWAVAPGVDTDSMPHHQLLRSMDMLVECRDVLADLFAWQLHNGLRLPVYRHTLNRHAFHPLTGRA